MEFLSKEAISRVLSIEAEANTIRENARSRAAEQIEACERECAERAAQETEQAKDEVKARLAMVRSRAENLIVQSREEAGADVEAMRESARGRMREAVKHIEWELCDI